MEEWISRSNVGCIPKEQKQKCDLEATFGYPAADPHPNHKLHENYHEDYGHRGHRGLAVNTGGVGSSPYVDEICIFVWFF